MSLLIIAFFLKKYKSVFFIAYLMNLIGSSKNTFEMFCEGVLMTSENETAASRIEDMSKRLNLLRDLMKVHNLTAYIVPTSDDHQSEYICDADKRREFISGFTGSAGTCLITMDKAYLWTDARYHIQAKKQVIPDLWTIEMEGKRDVDKMDVWLKKNMKKGDIIGVDPKKITINGWSDLHKQLDKKGIILEAVEENLIDKIWKDRPEYPKNVIYIHPIKYSGQTWEDKVSNLLSRLNKSECDCLVESSLDNIAWLLNLRGSDIKYSPVFIGHIIVTQSQVHLFVDGQKVTEDVKLHLQSNFTTQIILHDYGDFWKCMTDIVKTCKKVAIPTGRGAGTSYYTETIVKNQTETENVSSPIMEMKSYKNKVEAEGMRRAHVRDAVALLQLMKTMSEEVPAGIYWDEIKIDSELIRLRSEQELNRGPSFGTIAAYGVNSALPHYAVKNDTNLVIKTDKPLTIDSGGQYMDGTIDTTRVLHFGKPRECEKTAYTALLKGVIDLASTVFPEGTRADTLDFILRRPLYKVGRDYLHGSTHGTGSFLLVHESFNGTYYENFTGSQEPGYYKENDFGMRLENLVIVVPSSVEQHTQVKLLTFEPLTLVPYEKKLIDVSKLEMTQIDWLNQYHKKIKTLVGEEMLKQGKTELYEWLGEITSPITIN